MPGPNCRVPVTGSGSCIKIFLLYNQVDYLLLCSHTRSHIEDVPLGSALLGTELEIRESDDDSVGQLWIGQFHYLL